MFTKSWKPFFFAILSALFQLAPDIFNMAATYAPHCKILSLIAFVIAAYHTRQKDVTSEQQAGIVPVIDCTSEKETKF